MEFTSFTLEEAKEICEDFEDLKDTEFTIGLNTTYLVDDIVVSPFYEQDKQPFIEGYLASKDSGKALSAYSGNEYDILLFVADVDNNSDHMHIDIRTFAGRQGIGYNFPVHS